MSIPMEPVTVKFAREDIPGLKRQAEARGFEGVGEYMRHLVFEDRESLKKTYLALEPIFGQAKPESKEDKV